MTRDKAFFLGVEIKATDRKYTRSLRSTYTRNGKKFTRLPATGRIKMFAPIKNIVNNLKEKGFAKEIKKMPDKQKYVTNRFSTIKITKVHNPATKIVPCCQKK